MKLRVYIETLGCAKNQVDSEVMMGLLKEHGFLLEMEEDRADIIIVNTCGFINDAKQESIDTILSLAKYKEHGNCKLLIVAGCLGERYNDELLKELPEVDGIVGTGNFPQVVDIVNSTLKGERTSKHGDINVVFDENMPRILGTPSYSAYLKIAEGCDNLCTYCIIPKLRGKYRSREMKDIIGEAKSLASQGVKELIIIAQDTSNYGIDLYGEIKIGDLLDELNKIEGIKWIRILYCYPEKIDDKLIESMSRNEKVCKYIDMPIQHCSDNILKLMNRKTSKEHIETVIKKLREKIGDISIRTTLIVGFPGETEEDFLELKDFVKRMRFDRLGVFPYSKEEGTSAEKLPNQVEEDIKISRQEEIMDIQKNISFEKNNEKIGNIYDILIEEKEAENVYAGRSMYDIPDVDGIVYVNSEVDLKEGQIVKTEITDAFEYDLIGEMLDESC
ncbi:MAG: 30S ribosomal protein S12 methylthiotransferase RimO [Anaeromicrobium sp.]|jgi:ribosomal protein S12 methylthiotransferase|uniref:30S ribosomal protein S12 methylthiotransferase RimO n=1 Tax=Anaeromicrobium sp. TaxID=1929132 RepID=UPI0025F664CF|nr:30S ribosomal protein S12 methylthiotransferase RimO [Anaeromicrobium sp.]MCT4594674.1 30S ribosomal protein S12 methylthiotransferase RimO [Anaeromicrobium sp.]